MKIQVCGFDPSLTHWGIAIADLDLNTGELSTPWLDVVVPKEPTGKQVRANSNDLYRSEQLAKEALKHARASRIVFVEVPVGSQSARAMVSYAVCVGILSVIRAEGIPLIEVSPTENKVVFTGNKTATKNEMISQATLLYPDANWPRHKRDGAAGKAKWKAGELQSSAEHMADAIAAIHAGCQTDAFKTFLRVMKP